MRALFVVALVVVGTACGGGSVPGVSHYSAKCEARPGATPEQGKTLFLADIELPDVTADEPPLMTVYLCGAQGNPAGRVRGDLQWGSYPEPDGRMPDCIETMTYKLTHGLVNIHCGTSWIASDEEIGFWFTEARVAIAE